MSNVPGPGFSEGEGSQKGSGVTTTTGTIRLLTINDVYRDLPLNGLGGWAQLSTLVTKYRTPTSLFTLNGDFLGGSQQAEKFKGANVVEILNTIDLDYVVIGNHEFDYGPEILKDRIKESKFKWLGSNVHETSTHEVIEGALFTDVVTFSFTRGSDGAAAPPVSSLLKPITEVDSEPNLSVPGPLLHSPSDHHLRIEQPTTNHSSSSTEAPAEIETIRVGLFGVCTTRTPKLSFPGETVEFVDPLAVARKAVRYLRSEQNVDIVIALTHDSVEFDMQMASKVPGIDVMLGGHDHIPIARMEDSTLIFKTGQNAYYLGIVDLELTIQTLTTPSSSVRQVQVAPAWYMIPNKGAEPDLSCLEVINRYELIKQRDLIEHGLGEKILTVEASPESIFDQLVTRTDVVRRKESSFAYLIADAMKYYYINVLSQKCDFAIINGGFIRGDTVYPHGSELTLQDIAEELPFRRPTVMLVIKGRDIKEALEQELSQAPRPSGAFPHLSCGAQLFYDPSAEPMERVYKVLIDGQPLDPEASYHVAVTSFMASGGDSCDAFKKGDIILKPAPEVNDILVQYLRVIKKIDPKLEGRVQAIERGT